MKILETRFIREADQFTIDNEPVASIDLMERAATQLFFRLRKYFPNPLPVCVFAGPGNNGGDALALSRMLADHLYPVQLQILDLEDQFSRDTRINFERLPSVSWLKIQKIGPDSPLPGLSGDEIIIDGLFGSGLNRPLSGWIDRLVQQINSLPNKIIAIDIPSGLFGEDTRDQPESGIIRAWRTFSLHCPKYSMLMPENEKFVGQWELVPIGLDAGFVATLPAIGRLLSKETVSDLITERTRFSHKGDFGHALLIAGSKGKFGAAVLSAGGCLRSGVGLLTCHVPEKATDILHISVPEAMIIPDSHPDINTSLPDLTPFRAIGAGPGLGTDDKSVSLIRELLNQSACPLVFDADALNIISGHRELLDLLPPNTILTPHVGEFRRLFGEDKTQYDRIKRLVEEAERRKLVIILKGANTVIAVPGNPPAFNTTGNPGMATAGSGDVLTGIVLSLLAQGYSAADAAIVSVYLHGLAGDIAAASTGFSGLIASDIIQNLGKAWMNIQNAQ